MVDDSDDVRVFLGVVLGSNALMGTLRSARLMLWVSASVSRCIVF